MLSIPFIPDTAPFSTEQRAWLNGFLAGLYSENPSAGNSPSPAVAAKPVTILFGSQTGTSEALGKQAAKRLKALGCDPKVVDMADISPAALKDAGALLLITSTYGDGEPPDNARALHAALMAADAPRLENLEYAVLGLGDSSYPDFCRCSKDFDQRLAALGARRIAPTVECDVDTDEFFDKWILSLEDPLRANGVSRSTPEPVETTEPEWSKRNPFPARLLKSANLNKSGSAKETYHVEISLEGSGIEYEVGDALGIVPVNCPRSVNTILDLTGLSGEESVSVDADEGTASLRHVLQHRFDIHSLNAPIVQAWLERVEDAELAAIASDKAKLKHYLWGRELPDLIARNPSAFASVKALTGFLKKLQPRLYSISSSPRAHPGEVHLTVGKVAYECHGTMRRGVCSNYLADRIATGDTVYIYRHENKSFRLPEDDSLPIVMIGPGTGIAPFRAFLEEREARGAKGSNWLFFGDQHMANDFLYADQIDGWMKSGLLTRFDTAFSRDQKEKVYVQNRILEHADELARWIEQGAFIYVCGDASRMAHDVDLALRNVLERSGKTADEAGKYMDRLKKEKRYLRDVY